MDLGHVVVHCSGRTSRRALEPGELTVGADPTRCSVVLQGGGISPLHASFHVDRDGATVVDRGGGVKVNRAAARERRLVDGDEVQLGEAWIRYEAARPEPLVRLARDTADVSPPTLHPTQSAERVRRYQQRLGLLLRLASTTGADLGHQELLERVMETTFEAFRPERAVLALVDPDGQLHFEAARHAALKDPWRDLQVSGTILDRVIRSAQGFITADAMGSDEVGRAHSVARKRIRSAMCVPFHRRGEVAGALYVDHRGATDLFDEEDLELFILISHLASVALQNVDAHRRDRAELERLRAGGEVAVDLIGAAPCMEQLRRAVAKVARSDLPLLIQGERGTGKELAARAVHESSTRAGFVAVNCAAIPESLTESLLFGHEKGAFTGADQQRSGFFEQADGGTLFLDEIGDLRAPAQAAILRVLQEGEVIRVGADRTRRVNVRIIAATNRDLSAAAADGSFRGDLFDRINVLQLFLPPLRERMEDLPALAAHFAAGRARRISARALQVLRGHGWPGNVRELRNVIERAIVMGDGETIWPEDLPASLRAAASQRGAEGQVLLPSLESVERDHIVRVLRFTGGNISRAAEILGIGRITIYKKLKRYDLEPGDFKRPTGG